MKLCWGNTWETSMSAPGHSTPPMNRWIANRQLKIKRDGSHTKSRQRERERERDEKERERNNKKQTSHMIKSKRRSTWIWIHIDSNYFRANILGISKSSKNMSFFCNMPSVFNKILLPKKTGHFVKKNRFVDQSRFHAQTITWKIATHGQ